MIVIDFMEIDSGNLVAFDLMKVDLVAIDLTRVDLVAIDLTRVDLHGGD